MRILIGNLREAFWREHLGHDMGLAQDRAQVAKGYRPAHADPVLAAGLASTISPGWRYKPLRRFGLGGRRKRLRRIRLMQRAILAPPKIRIRYFNPSHPGECYAPGSCEGCEALDCKVRPVCCGKSGKLRPGEQMVQRAPHLRIDCACVCHEERRR